MSREQLMQVGAVLASHVDMLKGFLGDQFAVSVVARHKTGPCHLLLGDDTELTLIGTLSDLQRIGIGLVKDGKDTSEEPQLTLADHMVNLLRECSELLTYRVGPGSNDNDKAEALDLAARIDDVLEQCPPRAGTPTAKATEDTGHYAGVLPEAVHVQLRDPAPPPPPNVCPRCVEPLAPGETSCRYCGLVK